jgi:hypothetical protein
MEQWVEGVPQAFSRLLLGVVDGPMSKQRAAVAEGVRPRSASAREGESMIKIEVTTAFKDALEHAVASGTAQVALYKDKPVVILSYEEYERSHQDDDGTGN